MTMSSKVNWHSVHQLLLLLHVFHPQRMEESIKVGCCFFCMCCLCFVFVSFDCCSFGCFSCNFALFSRLLLLCLFHPSLWIEESIKVGCCFSCVCGLVLVLFCLIVVFLVVSHLILVYSSSFFISWPILGMYIFRTL